MKLKKGELWSALEETNRAFQRYPSEQTEWHWRFRVLKAEILHRQGLDSESLALVKTELPPALATTDLAIRRKLAQGIASAFTQQLPEADRFLTEAEALAKASHPDLLGEIALRKGTVCFLANETPEAEADYKKALQIAREKKDQFLEAAALEGLGVVATKREHYDEAIDWNRAALELARSVSAQHSLAQVLGNMGWSYRKLGDFDNALEFYKQAEEVSARSGLAGDQIYWLTGISNVYYELHDYVSAEAVLKQGLGIAQNQDDKNTLMEFLNDLSEIAIETGQIDLAEKYYKEAFKIEPTGLDQTGLLESQLVLGRIEESRHDFAGAEKSFRELARNPRADTSQRWEAESRLARVYAYEGLAAKAENEFRRSLATIETARSSVQSEESRLSFLSTAISFYSDYIEFLISRNRIDEALQVAELSRARALAEGLATTTTAVSSSPRNFLPQQVAQKLKASLLFYWIGQENSYLWVITPAKTTYFKLPKASEIEPLVKTYREALPNVDDALDTGASDGKKLYAMLVEPAKKLVPPGSRVILLPAESLYGLNFETLIAPDPKPHFWIEDVTLTNANSLALLDASIQRPAITGKNLLLVGNAVPTPGYPALPQAPVEIQKVGHYFSDQNRKVLEAKQATATAYLSSNPGQFAYLHFVTHGTASITRPLESAVILSPEGDTYKLYARDIVTHRLNAQLVTISACNGAGTRAYSGEGLVGLSWAFLRAGAHSVIGSLWEVSDASTPQLMDAFYRELFQGKDTATALRDAKLGLLHTSDPDSVFKKPNYWAPFQLYAGS